MVEGAVVLPSAVELNVLVEQQVAVLAAVLHLEGRRALAE
jgi:hypothetical protein